MQNASLRRGLQSLLIAYKDGYWIKLSEHELIYCAEGDVIIYRGIRLRESKAFRGRILDVQAIDQFQLAFFCSHLGDVLQFVCGAAECWCKMRQVYCRWRADGSEGKMPVEQAAVTSSE